MMINQRGFNLIELIVVITVLGIIMAGTASYITQGMTAYTDTVRREELANVGRATVERIARELRTALPNSIRVNNNCLEFQPVVAGSAYITLPLGAPSNTMSAATFNLPAGGGNRYVVVYPYNTGALYTVSNPGPIIGFNSVSGAPTATITFSAAHQFSLASPYQRFFIVSEPVSFCVVGIELRRYSSYGLNTVQAAPPASGTALLAENIQTVDNAVTVTPFSYSPGTLKRNAIVDLDLRYFIDGEWIRLTHEVQIRNVL